MSLPSQCYSCCVRDDLLLQNESLKDNVEDLVAKTMLLMARIEQLRHTLDRIQDITPSIGRTSFRDWELRDLAREVLRRDDEAAKRNPVIEV